MEIHLLRFCTTLILCFVDWTYGEQCDDLSTISEQFLGQRMKEEHRVLRMNTTSSPECARQCKLFGFCRSFNYAEATEECELNDKDSSQSPDDIEENAIFDYYDIDDWPSEIADSCADHSCQTAEICVPGPNNTAVCVTAAEFMDLQEDECVPNPCKNGAQCIDGVNRYTCECTSGWRGKDCDLDINECRSMPCEMGGTCVNQRDDFQCVCQDGWTGKRCEIEP